MVQSQSHRMFLSTPIRFHERKSFNKRVFVLQSCLTFKTRSQLSKKRYAFCKGLFFKWPYPATFWYIFIARFDKKGSILSGYSQIEHYSLSTSWLHLLVLLTAELNKGWKNKVLHKFNQNSSTTLLSAHIKHDCFSRRWLLTTRLS